MLQPGSIPDTEPLIRVGIILPEDRYTSVAIVIPPSPAYQLDFSGRSVALTGGEEIYFKHSADHIHFSVSGKSYAAPNKILLSPVPEKNKIAPGQGLLVKNVISGRDFHWKKYINASYSGTLILNRHEDRLIMINELPIEHYLMCVATSEMGAACPPALIEAQTITARSWMLANVEQKHVRLGMDVCNDDCCQRYQGTTYLTPQSIKGAQNTYGEVLIYDNQICDARYSKSCGGVMEAFEHVWPGPALPYLQIKADAENEPVEWQKPLSDEKNFTAWVRSVPHTFCSPHTVPEKELKQYLGSVDESGHYFRWQETISQGELKSSLKRFRNLDVTSVRNITILERGGSGRAKKAAIDYIDANGKKARHLLKDEYAIRQSLHKKFLYSSAFTVSKTEDQSFVLNGAGWGHGVGLCQIGALGMSLKKYNSKEIVLHYFPGSALKRIY